METYCKNEEVEEQSLNLITHIEVEPAHESDINALLSAIEPSDERGLVFKKLLADTLYGSDENCQAAAKMGVDVVCPAKSKDKEGITLSDFEISQKGDVFPCPQGDAPVITKTNIDRHSVAFDSQNCSLCVVHKTCPIKHGKNQNYLRYR